MVSVSTTTAQEDVSKLFEKYGFLAIPVVDAENQMCIRDSIIPLQSPLCKRTSSKD